MIKLYYAPFTRGIRVLWLLEELGLPYELVKLEFRPPTDTFFQQETPLGKIPTLEDGDVLMCESGAIVEYLLERYGEGRLGPVPGDPERAEFLQWLHFAEATAFPPLGIVAWLTRYKGDPERYAELVEDSKRRAAAGFDFVERALEGREHLLASGFSAADVMMGFTVGAARVLGGGLESLPRIEAYFERLQARPAFQKAMEVGAR